MIAQCHSK